MGSSCISFCRRVVDVYLHDGDDPLRLHAREFMHGDEEVPNRTAEDEAYIDDKSTPGSTGARGANKPLRIFEEQARALIGQGRQGM